MLSVDLEELSNGNRGWKAAPTVPIQPSSAINWMGGRAD